MDSERERERERVREREREREAHLFPPLGLRAFVDGQSCAKLPKRVGSSGLGCSAVQHRVREVLDRPAVAVVVGRRVRDAFPSRLGIVHLRRNDLSV